MNILHIHVGLSLRGGIESMIMGLANEMSKTQDVSICSLHCPTKDGIYYTGFNNSIQRYTLNFVNGHFSFSYLIKVYMFLKNSYFDTVNIHGFFYYYFFAILMLHHRINFFYTFHSDAQMENSLWDTKMLFLKKYFIKHGWIKPITISPESKRSFTDLYQTESRMIRNGIKVRDYSKKLNDIDFHRITPKTKVFLHPGRISKPKNQVVLCKVFTKLIAEGADVVLLIAGTKQSEEYYNLIKPYFSERIKYLGERKDIIELLSKADGMCLPSIWEGLPITLIEAFSVGCIPICAPVGGITGAIKNGENGLLSNSSSDSDYYKAMKKFLSFSDKEIMDMKRKSKESFSSYKIEDTAIQYIKYYKECNA